MAELSAKNRTPRKMPEKIGKYVIINEIGSGSTGRVFPAAMLIRVVDQQDPHGVVSGGAQATQIRPGC